MTDAQKKAYSIFLSEGFFSLDKESYKILQKYKYYSRLQEKNITTYVVWQDCLFGLYKIIDQCLCSVFFHEQQEIYWTIQRPKENSEYPLQQILSVLVKLCKKADIHELRIKLIDQQLLDEYLAVQNPILHIIYDIDGSEYIYSRDNLLNLKGTANYYKRKRIKKYINRKDISIQLMTKENVNLCLEIEDQWCSRQDCSYCYSFFGCEKKAIEIIVDIYSEEIHKGLLLFNEDKPVGYIICEQLNSKLSFLYFGKSTLDDGFVYLIYIMYKDYLKEVHYMNFNEDMGHPGLRKFKKLISPYELWHKYYISYSI